MKQGFTLIELLVVVLIIGILSAIALPQYQISVARTRAAQGIIAMKAVTDAQERYYMANGHYTTELEELDIAIPENIYSIFCVVPTSTTTTSTCYGSSSKAPFLEFYLTQVAAKNLAGKHWCIAHSAKEHRICRTFGPFDMGSETEKGYYLIN